MTHHARRWRPIPGRHYRALWAHFRATVARALRSLLAAAERTTEAWRLDSIEDALDLFDQRAAAAARAKIDQRRAALAGA